MPKPDPAHKETDKILRDMEKRLDDVYKQAYREARQTADDFMKQFREMDKKKRQQVKDGKLDKAEYERWRRTQVFQGNRYHQMADTLAADMTHTNQIAASVINGYLPEVYAVNHNYGTYEIEKGSRINTQYTMYDRQTVERLMRDNPDLLPRKAAVNVPKDQLWNKKHINSAITQGILQGEAIDKIAQRLAATVTDMSHTSAIRNARTMATSAQNGGRIDSYKRAEGMGIKMLQVWMATLDDRTRHEHRLLDGQKRKVGEPFEVDGEKIYFPGDPSAEPYLVYNCRCTLIGEVKGIDYKLSDTSQRDNKLGDMTYEEWKEEKRKQDDAEPSAPKPEPKPKAEEKPAEVEVPAPTVEKPDAMDEPIKPKLTIFDEMEQNRKEIDKTLHDVEEMRRSLDYEVGTIIDRKGNIVEVINGSEHSVAVDDGALKDLIFTHNHPSGGCFSDNDIINMIDDKLLELRASTPQGTYHSLLRTSKASKESSTELVKGFKKANSIVTATKQVQEDLKKGIITKQEAKDKGFNLYIEYMSKSGERFLTENAEKYGYIYTKGVI